MRIIIHLFKKFYQTVFYIPFTFLYFLNNLGAPPTEAKLLLKQNSSRRGQAASGYASLRSSISFQTVSYLAALHILRAKKHPAPNIPHPSNK